MKLYIDDLRQARHNEAELDEIWEEHQRLVELAEVTLEDERERLEIAARHALVARGRREVIEELVREQDRQEED